MTDKKTVHTAYGDVEIEVVTCASCNNEVAKKEAVDFIIGNRKELACQHCADEGPVNFPDRLMEFSIDNEKNIFLLIIFAPLMMPIITLLGFSNESDGFSEGYGTAVLTILIWIGMLLLISMYILL